MVEFPGLADLPSATFPPKGTVISRRARRSRSRMARREFMRVAGAAAVGTGLAFVGMFPTARLASATNLTPSTLWGGCYDGPFAGSTGCCACGSSVSYGYCGGDGWHKHHNEGGGTSYSYQYRLRTTSCGGAHNAWIWQLVGGSRWRCSDGQRRTCYSTGCTAWSYTVCAYQVV